jgi:hypothetical protein
MQALHPASRSWRSEGGGLGFPLAASESEERLDLIPDCQADQDGCQQK